MKKHVPLLLIIAVICLPSFCRAADVTEQEVTPKNKKIYLEPEKSILERGKFKFLLSTTEGYDNNVYLDSQREGDPYWQTFFRGNFTSALSQKTDLSFDYELMNLIYLGESHLDLMRNGIRAGMSHKLSKTLNFSAGYSIDQIEYINSGTDDYLVNAADFKLRQKLANKMYHSLGYELSWRRYFKRFIRPDADTSSEKKRQDMRNTLDYEIGKYFPKDLVKLSFQFFNNNSNETYLKYYDYDSYKVGASLTHLFNEKFTGYLSGFRQNRDFRSRTLINDAACKQHDRTYLYTAALYYSLNKQLSFGLSYTYRQNNSNEPIEKYSGSLLALSTYYKF